MTIIFIDFTSNIESRNKGRDSSYTLSIREQYEIIKSRMPRDINIKDTLEEFIEVCFPTGLAKKYTITTPNFSREKRERTYVSFLDNVAIKPEIAHRMDQYLPKDTNVVLFGDIQMSDNQRKFIVKGIELIDSRIKGKTDIEISDSYCVHAFGSNSISGRKQVVWSLANQDYDKTLFTPNFIQHLIENSYPLSNNNLKDFLKFYDKWNNFIDFRLNYLSSQSSRYFKVDSINVLEAYSINKNEYFQNESNYEMFLLVDHREFKNGEQILLNYEVSNSEPFNLVEVNIDYNKKEFDTNKVENNRGRMVNQTEIELKSFTRDNLALSNSQPTPETYEKILNNSYALDDRYKIISQDVEPDYSDIELKYDDIINLETKEIKAKHEKIYKQKLTALINEYKKEFSVIKENKLISFDNNFYDSLDLTVENNEDLEINNQIRRMIKEQESKLKKDKKIKPKELDEILINFKQQIDITSLYINKHNINRTKLENSITTEHEKELKKLESNKEKELKIIENNLMQQELDETIIKYQELKQKELDFKKENETIKRFSIYFKIDLEYLNDDTRRKILNNQFLIYNNRAEKAKIDRQKQSLDNFYYGNVKNPYLATYLFGADELVNDEKEPDFSNWNWHLEYLNDKQKEAVFKSVNSNGIFLLQGPPGTGKTQVIAEIVSQFVQRGKKVVIASETHKAIDNVFERLPYLADIRPLRLLPDKSSKDTEYRPENLVDNFYGNISNKMRKVISDYERFSEYKDNFKDEVIKLKMLNDKILREQNERINIQNQINELSTKHEHIKNNIRIAKEKINNQLLNIETLNRTYRSLESSRLQSSDDIVEEIIIDYVRNASEYLKTDNSLILDDPKITIREIILLNSEDLNDELRKINVKQNEFKVKQRETEIKIELNKLKDEYGEWIEGTEHLKTPLQRELKEILTQNNGIDFSSLKITKILNLTDLNNSLIIRDKILTHKENLIEIRNKYFIVINNELAKNKEVQSKLDLELNNLESERQLIATSIDKLRYSESYQNIIEDEGRIRYSISQFIENFNIPIKFNTYTEAINLIEQAYKDLEKNFDVKEQENKQIIPMFNKISKYLGNEDVILADRKKYTKILFDKANVFGITTTSRERFTSRAMSDLEEYNLDALDLKEQGIDVVIIDEVSKSNFLDLLTPILLGKTVILVGDHRQLPPMYDLRNLRDQDFENISEDILTKEQNEKYTELYETSFFKTLFEKIPSEYKVMLDKQYRSHEHIMQVYNCFYNNNLKVGKESQNLEKQHHLSIISNNRQIITPDKHVYFVDSKEFENRDSNSTSIYNANEAEVVVKLLELINNSYKNNKVYTKSEDEKMSVGVITTYGDQARVIRRRLKNSRINLDSFNKKADSKLIISTVDDFQGDERDIIILSMVRNPENRIYSNPGFITAFERVNVALSRARRLLIIVGNKSYLEDKGVVYLPDVYGNTQNDKPEFQIYREVIGAVARYGLIIDDEDVLGGKKQ